MDFSLGLIEVSALGNAIRMLDEMLKAADVEFVATERKLGGRLVTIVVKGELSSVKASVDAGIETAKKYECYKASNVIARPHEEILKFLHLDEEHAKPVNSESAATHVGAVNLPDHVEEKKPVSENEAKVQPETAQEKPARKAPARRGRRPKANPEGNK